MEFTPLMFAAAYGQYEVVKILLEKGAAVDAKSAEGATPLIIATQGEHLRIMKLLLERGATVDLKANTGFTALVVAVENGDFAGVTLLLEKRANANVEFKGRTALRLAEEKSRMDIADLLRKAGAK